MGRFITGIYNYCDYWCDRCAFKSRCRNYADEQALAKGASPRERDDATNQAFWNRLSRKLFEAAACGKADERDGDNENWLDTDWRDAQDARSDAASEAAITSRERAVNTHPLLRQADVYRRRTGEWLKRSDADLKSLAEEWMAAAGSGADDTDYEEAALEMGDLIEVVAWYHTLIFPKLACAVGDLAEPVSNQEETAKIIREARDYDAAGSGKVALIAVERSIAAWMRLREILPAQEDALLDLLVMLDRLRRGIRSAVPGAETFQRPGFDTGKDLFEE